MTTNAIGLLHLVPPAKGLCQECAIKHEPWDAHDATTLYYQISFYQKHGRSPTWADALAHLTPERRVAWETELKAIGVWTEPPPEALGTLPIITQERKAEETPVTPIMMYGDPRYLTSEKECS